MEKELYHVYNRGVDKRDIFMEEQDYLRCIHDLWEFNDRNPAAHPYYKPQYSEVGLPKVSRAIIRKLPQRPPRQLLVKLHAFCLMRNHFHLFVEPLSDTAMTEFMRKLGTGYTNYFNLKYKRSGALFQGIFKAVQVDHDSYFMHLFYYIHCNPLDYKFHSWRERKIDAPGAALKYLENYRWSSFPDYIGKKNFPSVTQRDFLNHFLGSNDWRSAMKQWLDDMHVSSFEDYLLE